MKTDKKQHGVSVGKVRGKKRLITVTLLFTAFLIILVCSSTISVIRTRFKKFYMETCAEVLESYTDEIVRLQERFTDELKVYAESEEAQNGNLDEILSYMKKNNGSVHDVIRNLWYANQFGDAYSVDGKKISVKDRDYCNAMFYGNDRIYISEGHDSKVDGKKTFVIACRAKREALGYSFFFYSINFDSIGETISRLSFSKKLSGFVISTNGDVYIAPSRYSIIRSNQNDLMEEDKAVFLDFCEKAKKQDSGFEVLKTQNFPEENIVYRHFSDSPWIVGLSIPETSITSVTAGLFRHMLAFFSLMLVIIIGSFWILEKKIYNPTASHRLTLQQDYDFDPLTGLWTEARFEEAGNRLLQENPDKNYMLLGIDVRGFRTLQMTKGVSYANECLLALSERLSAIALAENGIISRGATDHFYMIFQIKDKETALRKYESYLYNGNYLPSGKEYAVRTKTGIVFAGKDFLQGEIQDIIGKAGYARRMIKNNLMKSFAVFEDSFEKSLLNEQRIESFIPVAFERKEFYVVYQPKMDIRTNKIIGAEALVRWNSLELGKQNPETFIELFEKNGYITKLDFYVYREVFEFITRMLRVKNPIVPISVNVSRNHLSSLDFVYEFESLFAGYNISPSLVEIEIVERAASIEMQTIQQVMRLLHEKGFKIAIDDFGAGESSLNMLSDIPVDVIKLDQKFMRHSKGLTKESKQIIAKILEMTDLLGKEIICEGVETLDQIEFLKSVNCNEVQGYYYSRPLEEEAFIQFIKDHL